MAYSFRFVRVGGFDQVEITTGDDLEALHELDQKLWVALACPVKGTELDERTLALIDADHDGRIRAPELLAAVKWACAMMKDADDLTEGSSSLALSAIDDSSAEGALLKATAKTLLKSLGKPDAKSIAVADTEKAVESFSKERQNGDGVVPAEGTPDDTTKALVTDVLACTATPAIDRCGAPGVTKEIADAFFVEVDAHATWLAKGETPAIRPLDGATGEAWAALAAVRPKIEDYFARVKIAAYDPRALTAVNGEEKQYLELAAKDLTITTDELERLPLALVAVGQPLSLARGVSPAWTDRLTTFATKVVRPLVGERAAITEADFAAILGKLAAHEAWTKEKAGLSAEKLGEARVRELASSDARKTLAKLIEEDAAKEPEAKAIESVEKLVRLNRDLLTLVNNFVSFRDFYSRKGPAIFQIGTLYLDQRACELCVRVIDPARHAAMGPLSNCYLVYADAKNAKGETMPICAAMTAGDVDNLMVGRNGLFYDRKGGDWDATITRIVDNPISVRQAFWSPYKKVLRMIEEYIARRAAAEAEASDAAVTANVENVRAVVPPVGAAPAAPAAPAAAAPAPAAATSPAGPPRSRFDIGTIAALGVAVGGITAALGALLAAFFGLGLWMPLGFVGLIFAISGPSMAVAWLKLRKRNLGPILDANGWAVNARALVNVPLGGSLTGLPVLPKGSKRQLADPFAEKKRPWSLYVFLLALLVLAGAWYLGKVDRFLPERVRSTTVLGEYAPAAPASDAEEDEEEEGEPAAP